MHERHGRGGPMQAEPATVVVGDGSGGGGGGGDGGRSGGESSNYESTVDILPTRPRLCGWWGHRLSDRSVGI